MKCLECNGCTDIVYFGPKRFFYCDFCDLWFDGLNGKFHIVKKEDMEHYFWEYGVLSNTKLSTEHNSDK